MNEAMTTEPAPPGFATEAASLSAAPGNLDQAVLARVAHSGDVLHIPSAKQEAMSAHK